MRVRRWLVVATVTGATLALAPAAGADGGAYIEMDRTHYLVGDTAEGVGYVAIPEPKQGLLEQGPFYVYVVPEREWIQENRPLPGGVIRVGTAAIEHDSGTAFEIRVSFTVPDVSGAYYNLQICNDPCTISGFRESLSAYMSIVHTQREAQLLNEQQELWGKFWSVRHQLKKAQKTNEDLATSYEQSRDSVLELSAEVSRLERELEAALAGSAPSAPTTESDGRPLADAWVLFALGATVILALTSIGLAMVFSRRRAPRIVVPDTIEELDEAELVAATTSGSSDLA